MIPPPPRPTLFPYTTLFRSVTASHVAFGADPRRTSIPPKKFRSEEHTSELQSHHDLVCRLLLEKKKKNHQRTLDLLHDRSVETWPVSPRRPSHHEGPRAIPP